MIHTIDKYKIIENEEVVGEIALWQYSNQKLPNIEYKIKPEHQNKGIMKKHLPIYLDRIKGFGKVLAVVMDDNLISIKLLLANGFKELKKINNKRIFICGL
jgi:RimJ/RimL family protein N-acetyltransferase